MTSLSIVKNKRIFIDTSAHFALANSKDLDHQRAKIFLKQLSDQNTTLIVSNFVIAETYTLMLKKIGRDLAIHYIESLRRTAVVEQISEPDEKRAWEIILNFQDKDFSYVDATSFAVMERLGLARSFAFDDHFQ